MHGRPTVVEVQCDHGQYWEALADKQIDEAHERGAYTDLLLGLLKKIMKKRPELRIIVSSATIDAYVACGYVLTSVRTFWSISMSMQMGRIDQRTTLLVSS